MKRLMIVFLTIISAQTFSQNSFNTKIISDLYSGGQCSGGLFILSHYLFLGRGNTLSILDITNNQNPEIIANYFIGMEINEIVAEDSLCIVAGREPTGITWIFVLNIENKENITEIARLNLNYDIISEKIIIKDNYLIIPTNSKVSIFDISAFPSFQLIGSISTGDGILFVDINYHYLFLNHRYNNNSKILVYDVTDISNPILISSFPVSGYSDRNCFIIRDSLMFSFGSDVGIVNINDPYSLQEISHIALPEYCYTGEIKDSALFLYNLTSGHLFTLKFSIPGDISITDTTEIPEFSYNKIANDYLYGASDHLDIYSIDDSSNLSLTGEFQYSHNLGGIYYKDGMIYTVDLPNKLCGLDVSNPLQPYFRDNINLGANLEYWPDIDGANSILIVGPYIYDISNKDTIRYLSQINNPSNPYVYRSCNDTLLEISNIPSLIYSIRDPNNPVYLGSFGSYYNSVSFADTFVFGAPGSSNNLPYFEVYNISDPNNPIFVQRPFLNYDELIYSLNVKNNIISLLTGDGVNNYNMILYQFSNYNSAPVRKGSWEMNTGFTYTQKRENENVFIQHGTSYLSKINISDLNQPVEVARFGGFGETQYFEVNNDTVYLINSNGFFIIDFDYVTNIINTKSLPNKFVLSQNYPNPFNPTTKIKYQIPELSNVKLSVYDILGREVRTLVNEEKPAGSYEVEFNGTDLSSGIYFYRIETAKYSDTKKFVLLK